MKLIVSWPNLRDIRLIDSFNSQTPEWIKFYKCTAGLSAVVRTLPSPHWRPWFQTNALKLAYFSCHFLGLQSNQGKDAINVCGSVTSIIFSISATLNITPIEHILVFDLLRLNEHAFGWWRTVFFCMVRAQDLKVKCSWGLFRWYS